MRTVRSGNEQRVNHDPDDAGHTTFVRLRRSRLDASSEELVLSRAAMQLHTFGVLFGIEAGTPGFVSDGYLSAISAETSITALELRLAGLWERTSCGYRVSDTDTLTVAAQIHGHVRSEIEYRHRSADSADGAEGADGARLQPPDDTGERADAADAA